MIAKYALPVEQAMPFTFSALNERHRRIYAATEVLKLGHGGIAYIAELLGCHRRTVERGLNELRQSDSLLPPQRARKKGGGGNAV
jgi:hypothetical protein